MKITVHHRNTTIDLPLSSKQEEDGNQTFGQLAQHFVEQSLLHPPRLLKLLTSLHPQNVRMTNYQFRYGDGCATLITVQWAIPTGRRNNTNEGEEEDVIEANVTLQPRSGKLSKVEHFLPSMQVPKKVGQLDLHIFKIGMEEENATMTMGGGEYEMTQSPFPIDNSKRHVLRVVEHRNFPGVIDTFDIDYPRKKKKEEEEDCNGNGGSQQIIQLVAGATALGGTNRESERSNTKQRRNRKRGRAADTAPHDFTFNSAEAAAAAAAASDDDDKEDDSTTGATTPKIPHKKQRIPTGYLKWDPTSNQFPLASETNPYQKYRCNGMYGKCKKQVRTFCACDPFRILCDDCFVGHCSATKTSCADVGTTDVSNGGECGEDEEGGNNNNPMEHKRQRIPTGYLKWNAETMEFPKAKESNKYQRYKCMGTNSSWGTCTKQVRTYCACNPERILCDDHLIEHRMEEEEAKRRLLGDQSSGEGHQFVNTLAYRRLG